MATLADLVRKRRTSGGSVGGSLSYGLREKFKEKIDPRRFLNQSGVLTALFPQLKAYEAGGKSKSLLSKSITPTPVGESPSFNSIENSTKIAAKNTLVLPAIHRDINVMRQNIIKLVKLKGGTPTNKADMYFMNAKTQEAAYESRFGKNKPEKIDKTGAAIKPEEEEESGEGILEDIKRMIEGAVGGIFGPRLTKFIMTTVFEGVGLATLVGIIGGMLGKTAVEAKYSNIRSWGGTEAEQLARKRDEYDTESEVYHAYDARINENKDKFQAFKKEFMVSKGFEAIPQKGGTFDYRKNVAGAGRGQKTRVPTAEEMQEANSYAEGKMAEWNKTRPALELPSNKTPASSVPPPKVDEGPKPGTAAYVRSGKNAKQSDSSPTPTSVPTPEKPVSKVEQPTPSPTPRNVAATVDRASVETKQTQEEVSKTPIVNVVESTKEKTINRPASGTSNISTASVYDTEFLKMIGMEIA